MYILRGGINANFEEDKFLNFLAPFPKQLWVRKKLALHTYLASFYIATEQRWMRLLVHLTIIITSPFSGRQGFRLTLIYYCLRIPQYFWTLQKLRSDLFYTLRVDIGMSMCQFVNFSNFLYFTLLFFSPSCVPHFIHSVPIALSGVWGWLVDMWGISKVRLWFLKCQSAE